jgi:hypothetical protein
VKHNNESIRELVNRANDKGWRDSELNKQVIEADVSRVTDMSKLFYRMEDFLKESDVIKDNNASLHKNLDIGSGLISKILV